MHSITQTNSPGFGRLIAEIDCFDKDGNHLLAIDGLEAQQSNPGAGSHLAMSTDANSWLRLVWKPDINGLVKTAGMSNLIPRCKATLEQIRSVEKIVGYLSEEIVQKGLHLDDQSPPHFHLYSAWLQHQAERYRNEVLICSDMDETTSVADSGIGFAVQVPEDIAEFPDIRLALKIASKIQNIFAREEDALAITMGDELLSRTYEEGLLTDGVNDKVLFLAQLLSHQNPRMKILEIGAGTGGTTLPMLRGLTAVDGKKMYQTYTFTDISAGVFEKAKQKLSSWEDVEYRVLNIEKDPAEQGLSGKYDLVVAANVCMVPCWNDTS